MRRKQNGPAHFVSRPQASKEIEASRHYFLEFDFKSGAGGD
jgi:hypothetical protein